MLNCRRVWRTCDGLGERAFSIRPRQFMVLKMLILGLESHGWVSIRSITRPLSLLEWLGLGVVGSCFSRADDGACWLVGIMLELKLWAVLHIHSAPKSTDQILTTRLSIHTNMPPYNNLQSLKANAHKYKSDNYTLYQHGSRIWNTRPLTKWFCFGRLNYFILYLQRHSDFLIDASLLDFFLKSRNTNAERQDDTNTYIYRAGSDL